MSRGQTLEHYHCGQAGLERVYHLFTGPQGSHPHNSNLKASSQTLHGTQGQVKILLRYHQASLPELIESPSCCEARQGLHQEAGDAGGHQTSCHV